MACKTEGNQRDIKLPWREFAGYEWSSWESYQQSDHSENKEVIITEAIIGSLKQSLVFEKIGYKRVVILANHTNKVEQWVIKVENRKNEKSIKVLTNDLHAR
jgi:hypothetical protein